VDKKNSESEEVAGVCDTQKRDRGGMENEGERVREREGKRRNATEDTAMYHSRSEGSSFVSYQSDPSPLNEKMYPYRGVKVCQLSTFIPPRRQA
jgi:hypothetical protein